MDDVIYIFISPHLDDAVLSCGGYIHHLTSLGKRVVITTVVTADDKSGLPRSWLAQRNLRKWGNQAEIFAVRCLEDIAAAKRLGAEVVHLGFLDCIYRHDTNQQPLYRKNVIGVPIHPDDWQVLAPTLAEALKALFERYVEQKLLIFCPLAIGKHVDHILVRQVVESLISSQQRLYYEDFPYAFSMKAFEPQLEDFRPLKIDLTPDDIKARLEASACYRSQIPGLFPSRFEIIWEIASSRLPLLGQFLQIRTDKKKSIERMNQFTQLCVQERGGERYWAHATACTTKSEIDA
ncbi:MAG TPA: PIG-L family deacetylase [Anaerolineales bacterium]|nr:PIG-L family deacetylase [Anaerolineales bacterium]HLO33518.1 PIG-L family deacetylase [Anaerolineales bacterium]